MKSEAAIRASIKLKSIEQKQEYNEQLEQERKLVLQD